MARTADCTAAKKPPRKPQRGLLDFRALDRQPLLTGSPENALRQFFDYCCVLDQIHPQIRLASSHNLDVINAMHTDMGIATLNSSMARRVVNPDIRIRQLKLPCEGYLYGCVPLYSTPDTPGMQALEFAQEYYAHHPVPLYSSPL